MLAIRRFEKSHMKSNIEKYRPIVLGYKHEQVKLKIFC